MINKLLRFDLVLSIKFNQFDSVDLIQLIKFYLVDSILFTYSVNKGDPLKV